MTGYKWDVFISYSRKGMAQKWLLNHFYERLLDCLIGEMSYTPRVYMDRLSIAKGAHWPSDLQQALLHSKMIVPLFTPPYFRSPWCMAEFHSMRARQKMLGIGGGRIPQGLIYPVLYSDSDNFPPEAREFSWWNFKDVSNPDPVFQMTRDFHRFHDRVAEFASDLAKVLEQVPEWEPDWPLVVTPDPVLMPPPLIPRFGDPAQRTGRPPSADLDGPEEVAQR
ncbi:hypothetical protein JOD54_006184 [Actinokineospora baliensis]|uniref:toll/interleukin-1 receptor domain-containing protein n=1 Tax=Actinokineospora baliensis TaxID=547056 RepID=UPI00195B0154|nr:toll/interleukin-1 receptor domain-containing protein [Actinokineospora baliensis]MBM7775980.1 hypothetical protein [Actinokineospora baliensis]